MAKLETASDEIMTDMTAFLASNAIQTKDMQYVASKRFRDKDGNPIPWRLHVLTNDELDAITKRCKKKEFLPKTREYKVTVDNAQLELEMICKSVVYPNLNDERLQDSYGTIGAAATVKAMLTPGEYTDLGRAVTEAAGYQMGMNDQVSTAKN